MTMEKMFRLFSLSLRSFNFRVTRTFGINFATVIRIHQDGNSKESKTSGSSSMVVATLCFR